MKAYFHIGILFVLLIASSAAVAQDPNYVGQDGSATPSATGVDALAMGDLSSAPNNDSIAIGQNSDAGGQHSIAIGGSNADTNSADAIGEYGVAVGLIFPQFNGHSTNGIMIPRRVSNEPEKQKELYQRI